RVSALGLQDGSFRFYRDDFLDVSWLQDQVNTLGRVYDQIDVGPGGSFKAGLFDSDLVRAWGQVGKYIVAALVRLRGVVYSRFGLRDCHLRIANSCTRFVSDRSQQCGIDRLASYERRGC